MRIHTPLGLDLLVESTGECIVSSRFTRGSTLKERRKPGHALLDEARRQIDAYFARKLARFDLPLTFDGTEFECDVWRCVADLAFGEFVSYADVARAVGRPFAHRGVARAIGRTELALFVPAHRVVGSDGRPRGISPRSTRLRLIEFEHSARV